MPRAALVLALLRGVREAQKHLQPGAHSNAGRAINIGEQDWLDTDLRGAAQGHWRIAGEVVLGGVADGHPIRASGATSRAVLRRIPNSIVSLSVRAFKTLYRSGPFSLPLRCQGYWNAEHLQSLHRNAKEFEAAAGQFGLQFITGTLAFVRETSPRVQFEGKPGYGSRWRQERTHRGSVG